MSPLPLVASFGQQLDSTHSQSVFKSQFIFHHERFHSTIKVILIKRKLRKADLPIDKSLAWPKPSKVEKAWVAPDITRTPPLLNLGLSNIW